MNEKNGKFRDVSKLVGPAIQVPQVSRGVAVGDLFNTGHLKIVVENLTGGPMILRAKGAEENHWISLEFEGAEQSSCAEHARDSGFRRTTEQIGEVLSGGSYLSQNDLRLHFGLGEHKAVERLEITWPTGKTEIVNNLAADRFYKIKEGSGVVSSK